MPAELELRPIRDDDEERLRRMFFRLSPQTVYRRFFTAYSQPPAQVLHRLSHVDHQDRVAVVATCGDEIVGVARFDRRPGTTEAELAVTVEDAWQQQGLGRRLLERLRDEAATRGVTTFTASVLADNRSVLRLVASLPVRTEVVRSGREMELRTAV